MPELIPEAPQKVYVGVGKFLHERRPGVKSETLMELYDKKIVPKLHGKAEEFAVKLRPAVETYAKIAGVTQTALELELSAAAVMGAALIGKSIHQQGFKNTFFTEGKGLYLQGISKSFGVAVKDSLPHRRPPEIKTTVPESLRKNLQHTLRNGSAYRHEDKGPFNFQQKGKVCVMTDGDSTIIFRDQKSTRYEDHGAGILDVDFFNGTSQTITCLRLLPGYQVVTETSGNWADLLSRLHLNGTLPNSGNLKDSSDTKIFLKIKTFMLTAHRDMETEKKVVKFAKKWII